MFVDLPRWLRGQKIAKVYYRGHKTDHAKTDLVKIQPKAEDKALLVGNSMKTRLTQENLDREGYGRQRCFDANAKGGKSGREFSEAEREAAKVASSIEK